MHKILVPGEVKIAREPVGGEMAKNWLLGVAVGVLVAGTSINGYVIQSVRGALSEAEQRAASLGAELETANTGFDDMKESLGTLRDSFAVLGDSFAGLGAEVEKMQQELGSMGTASTTLNSDLDGLQERIDGINSAITSIQLDVSNIQGSELQLNSNLTEMTAPSEISMSMLAALVEPSIVRVDTDKGSGSGTIISATGYVLTNYHVIDGADKIRCSLITGEVVEASVISTIKSRDLAIVRLDSNRDDFPFLQLGYGGVNTGDPILAAGFPLGELLPGPASFSSGIVSAIRTLSDGCDYYQIDAAINPGNSGGALVNMRGEIVGIICAVVVDASGGPTENLALAVPISAAKMMIAETENT